MGMASPHDLDPDWYDGSNYTVIVALPPSSMDVYFDGRAMVGPSWDFVNSDIHKWLEENYKGKFNHNWGIELEDDRMLVYIGFAKEEYVKAFKEKFETIDWNIECDDATHWFDIKLFYNLEDYNDDDACEKELEVIQRCRENIQHIWKYVSGAGGTSFYFAWEGDAAAFKLRWL